MKRSYPQYVGTGNFFVFEKNLVKRKIFREKNSSRQNALIKTVTKLSRFFSSFMLTARAKKVLFPACGKTCGECGKLNAFKDISPNRSMLSTGKIPSEKFAKP